MSAIKGAVNWAGEHPVTVAVGVFAFGAIVLLMLSGRKGGVAANNGMGAFYAAQASQAASGNSLMAVQAQGKTATAIAQIAADRDKAIATTGAGVATVQSQTDLGIAQVNADVLNNAELTRQQAQRQQFFLGVGAQQIEGQAFPYFLQDFSSGNPVSSAAALTAWQALIAGGANYHPAH